jgi:hypothetical protein
VDGRGGQITSDPALHHRLDVAVGKLPRVEVAVLGVMPKFAEEARAQPLPVEHGVE